MTDRPSVNVHHQLAVRLTESSRAAGPGGLVIGVTQLHRCEADVRAFLATTLEDIAEVQAAPRTRMLTTRGGEVRLVDARAAVAGLRSLTCDDVVFEYGWVDAFTRADGPRADLEVMRAAERATVRSRGRAVDEGDARA